MTHRENLLSLLRREGFARVPATFTLCPSLVEEYHRRTGSDLDYRDYFDMPWRDVEDIRLHYDPERFRGWYRDTPLQEGTEIDIWGVAHEPGSSAAMHMTRMHHPLRAAETLEELQAYPFPRFQEGDNRHQRAQVAAIHKRGLAAVGNMQCTIWETAWYIRSMEALMMDMMESSPLATFLLDSVTDQAVLRARSYAEAGADIVYLGDDIGMQRSVMMSETLYRTWIKPRLKRVVEAVKAANPGTLVSYHSCGYILPFIDDLVEVGVDILNPIQAECMDYHDVVARYRDRLSFHGCVGTQTVMPFGTPDEVRAVVTDCLDTVGDRGGMLAAPTHILEPEVPWENIMAFVEACGHYSVK